MEGISDIRIIGVDEKRPAFIRKEPYIDLFFELSHQAPADWCRGFNELLAQHPSKPNIKEKEGKYIEAWVRTPDEIVEFVDLLKATISECTRQYIERIELSAREANGTSGATQEASGEQGRLNRIIASLQFDETD
jgi:hypothetical protein